VNRSDRAAHACALLIVALAIGLTIRFNIFTAWGTDSAAYLHAAQGWARGDVFTPASLVFWAPWALDGFIESPLGHRPGPTKGTVIGQYPLGFPLLVAAALRIAGDLGAYLVAPLCLGLLAWCAFRLGTHLSGPWAGVIASALVAGNPVTLLHATQPMSDVPAAALWAASWVFAMHGRTSAAASAGIAAAGATMVRPNLAPLGLVIAALVLTRGGASRWYLRLLVFGACAAIGPAVVLWSQAALYGDPFAPGYPGYAEFFSLARVPANAANYPALVGNLHTPLLFAGLLAVPWTVSAARRDPRDATRGTIALAALAVIAINYALYLPYLTYEGWDALRFVLPALTACCVLFAGLIDQLRQRLAARSRWLALLVVVPVAIVVLPTRDEVRYVFDIVPGYQRVRLMGHYMREALPRNAVVLTFYQSAATAMYTGRPVVRLDLLDPTSLTRVIDDLVRRRHRPLLVIDDVVESRGFRAKFQGSPYGMLDWRERATFTSGTAMWLMDPQDRARYVRGETWPVDVLRAVTR
jgi:hypothetical protein